MNDDLRDRLDAVEQAVDPEPSGWGVRIEWVDDDGNETSVDTWGDGPREDADTVIRLDRTVTDPEGPEGSDR